MILIVDDDEAVRAATERLLLRKDHCVRTFANGDALLAADDMAEADCILLDIRMPGTDGLGVLRALRNRTEVPPVVMMTGHGDVPIAVEAMQLGAADFVEKPYTPERLFHAIEAALQMSPLPRTAAPDDAAAAALRRLPWRQQQVLAGIAQGHPNKIIAFKLGLSPRTVEAYRAKLLTRLNVRGTAEAVRFALAAGLDTSIFEQDANP
ncbi:response regulator [Sphingomonas sp. HF-S4]|uniref:Response regulator n=1 Tax=Sphingomonas agrestis TaxID=3080540 RepID=A0ABU3Y6W1_9SPHN|nr:response regulator [Sphingomonas sp. HF-S4]MDV3456837.1 response regulator [Sphingomonas sp. HF-S4]